MLNGHRIYTEVKKLLDKYNLVFASHEDYERYIRELTDILRL